MKNENGTMRIAAIGDLHASTDRKMGDFPPLHDLFAEMSERADVVALCGDLTNLGTIKEAELLGKELQACKVPVVAVLGNHDHECGIPEEVMRVLGEAGVLFLEEQSHEINGVGFAGVKGFAGGFDRRMLSAFGESAIKHFVEEAEIEAKALERHLAALNCDRIVVVLHYAPIAATVEGEPPEIFPFLGSSRLAEVIDRFDVAAVFHGHAHHGSFTGRTPKGIPVYNCAQPVIKEGGKPYAVIEV
ncbi:metallophosphoesterase [Telmatospirillum sp. J64-1]|uniref:metallophosphoesterase family protein n=1 Tax=Telmatospirillum sp. J64-1 TaxID=2502183 RepID=UPI00115F3EE9|nr:metallophosphoesterase [Telmatospirillum sp. J64-1]